MGTLADTLDTLDTLDMQASGKIKPGAMAKQFSQQGYGAHSAEAAVKIDTGAIRVRRLLGVFARRANPERKNRQKPDYRRDDLGRGHGVT